MKKLKLLLFILPFLIIPNVFATSKEVINYIRYDTDNPTGTYKGDEIYNGGYNGKFNVNTRYNGRLSLIEFYLSTDNFDFKNNTTYTITLNMATNDWRNNFMGPQVREANLDGSFQSSSLTVSNFQFVSRKSIKFNFKTDGSLPPYLFFRLYSSDYATTNNIAITGDTNWNLSSIVISDNSSSSSSGGSSSSGSGSTSNGGASVSGSTLTCNNGLVLSSHKYTWTDTTIRDKYLDSDFNQVSYSNWGIIPNIPITKNTTYLLTRSFTSSSVASYCLLSSPTSAIVCNSYGTAGSYNIDSGNANYISLSLKYGESLILSSCVSSLDNQNQNTQDIINNQNQNTTNIIENNNDNTQNIIDSQYENTQDIIAGITGSAAGVIANENQNTQDIINNQNQNAQNTQNTINDTFGNSCRPSTNLFEHDDVSYSRNSGTINVNYSKGVFNVNGTTNGGTWVIGHSNSSGSLAFKFGHFSPGRYYLIMRKIGGSLTTADASGNVGGLYVRVSTNTQLFSTSITRNTDFYGHVFTIDSEEDLFLSFFAPSSNWVFNDYQLQFQLVKGDQMLPFEEPGKTICTNKLDDLNSGINDTNDYLKDDSDPTIDSSALNDVFGRVHFTDPLSYLLTLPTQLINKIVSLSDSCSAIDFGTLYGVHLTMPCINLENYLGSDLWNLLDVILSVGLLAVILKNFYDTISNLLTLGGEKEAKEKFSMPTPMDFLAMILGGDNR